LDKDEKEINKEYIKELKEEIDQSDVDMSELLQELRILLQGSQVLTAFLIILPFNQLFDKLNNFEKYIYLATFLCAITCLVLFTAPATQHRLVRPLINRVDFKHLATRLVIIGLVPLSLALVLVVQLIVSQVVSFEASFVIAGIFALGLLVIWWVYPLLNRNRF
jgi:magnesium-transporting ATPase (P-type)